jgi:hypothetical protein
MAAKKPLSSDALAQVVQNRMTEILALIEAMAAQETGCDVRLAKMLENESEQVRVAIVEKLRELIRERAAEKEQQLNQYIEAGKRQVIEQQRSLFMNWLRWIMSEETLRKIRMMFAMQPGIEQSVKSIGQELAAKGVLNQIQLTDRRELGGLANNVPNLGQGQDKGTDKGRF